MRKKLLGGTYPRDVISIGAQSKFSYFFLKCPTGTENYGNRKRLSVVILEYLFKQWYASGQLKKEWYQFYDNKLYEGSDKKDDYADAALQLIVYLLERLQIAPQWEALEALYAFLLTNPRYGPVDGGGITRKWPLAFTSLGEEAFEVLMRRADRENARANKRLTDLVDDVRIRLNDPKTKKKPVDEDKLAELDTARSEIARSQAQLLCVRGFKSCHWMLGNRVKNKGEPQRIDVASEVFTINGKARRRKQQQPKVDPLMEQEYAAISASDKRRRIAAPSFAGKSTAADPNDYGVDLLPDNDGLDALMAAATSS